MPDTEMQLLYIDQCIEGTLNFIKADRSNLKRCVYNFNGITVSPATLAVEVAKLIPGTTISYNNIDPVR